MLSVFSLKRINKGVAAWVAKKDAVESNLQPETEKTAVSVTRKFSGLRTIRTSEQLNVSTLNHPGTEITLLSVKVEAEDGLQKTYDCANLVKGFERFHEGAQTANGKPVKSWATREAIALCGGVLGYDQLICVPQETAFSSVANTSNVYDPGTQTGNPFDHFN